MSRGHQNDPKVGDAELAAGLHDVCAGLAVGIGLLKDSDGSAGGARAVGVVIDAFEDALAELRRLSRMVVDRSMPRRHRGDLSDALQLEARSVGIALELDLIGKDDWLAGEQAELIRLVGREAIRNVKRHSGTASCRMTIDASNCPLVLRVRDQGAGMRLDSREGDGIAVLKELATTMGCELTIESQPGVGTEVILVGRRCPLTGTQRDDRGLRDERLRSVVADESLGSRKRVAAGRPIRPSEEQIT